LLDVDGTLALERDRLEFCPDHLVALDDICLLDDDVGDAGRGMVGGG
jgi:hypothetical protein